jgi:hypothetical protein
MTALLDRTHAFPAARRSTPDALRTTRVPAPPAPAPTPETTPPARGPVTRRRPLAAALLGAAVAIAGAAAFVGVSADEPLPPLPAPAPVVSPTGCVGASCEGLDPTGEGCQHDAQTVASRIVTAERRGLEVPVGVVELRASAACRAVWGRYTVDATAPAGEVSVQSRDGRSESTAVEAVGGHRHLGYGTTPMLTGAVDVRALVSPGPGGELPSNATVWTGAR